MGTTVGGGKWGPLGTYLADTKRVCASCIFATLYAKLRCRSHAGCKGDAQNQKIAGKTLRGLRAI
eukprot:8519989-Pyramimonas_sp.AAC.1